MLIIYRYEEKVCLAKKKQKFASVTREGGIWALIYSVGALS
jgi:hypothetical protein